MNRMLIAAALLAVAVPAFSQPAAPPAETLEWMSGHWMHDTGREKVFEAWIGPANGMLVGSNLAAGPGGRRSFEHMRIAESPAGLSYFASPGGRAPVEFRFREAGERKVVFENPRHDYPQRITYWREGDMLMARIEGTLRGRARAEEWRFVPVRPASAAHSGG